MDDAIFIANTLIKQGKATLVENMNDEQQLIKDALEREALNEIVNAIDSEEADHKIFVRDQAKEDSDLIKIGLDFPTTIEAVEAEKWINDLGISKTQINMKKGVVMLIVEEITPLEYGKISRKFQTEKAIKIYCRLCR